MTIGMVGLSGVAVMTKKLGGYVATKNHGMLAGASVLCNVAGVYCIYLNKERNGFQHFKSYHGTVGMGLVLVYMSLGLVGGIVLHPDFGLDKGNKIIRMAHKLASRLTIAACWVTAFVGLNTLTKDPVQLAMFGIPLVALMPVLLV